MSKQHSVDDILWDLITLLSPSTTTRGIAYYDALKKIDQCYYKLITERMPKKLELFEPVTKRLVGDGDGVTVDLGVDVDGSLMFVQNNGFNVALSEVHAVLKELFGVID